MKKHKLIILISVALTAIIKGIYFGIPQLLVAGLEATIATGDLQLLIRLLQSILRIYSSLWIESLLFSILLFLMITLGLTAPITLKDRSSRVTQ